MAEVISATPPTPDPLILWCNEFCPTLPRKIDNIVADWNLNDKQHHFATHLILTAVKSSVASS